MRKRPNIDRDVLWEKIGYEPHSAAQKQFHDSDARFRTAVCGRRFGKSTMAAVDMIEACFLPNCYLWIVGPTYSLAEKEFRIIYNAFCMEDKLNMAKEIKKAYNVKQGDMRLEFPWGTKLMCVSATNPDSLIGEGLTGVIMSEAARHDLITWEMYIEPALTDNLGFAIFPTTPKGFNWIQGLWQIGQHSEYPDYDSWKYPTWLNTKMYPENTEPDEEGCANEELQRIKRNVTKAFWQQEYAASFTSFEGQIYDEFEPAIHVKDIEYRPEWRNFMAFDYGWKDPFVCLDIMMDPSDNVYVWREYQVSYKSTWDHGWIIRNRENPEGYHVDSMFGDPRGPDEAATLAHMLGTIWSEDVPRNHGYEAIKRWLKLQPDGHPKLFIDRSCDNLIRQMQTLHWAQTKEGRNSNEKQHDWDDHGPDALRYFFSQYIVKGLGSSLADVYGRNQIHSEAATFFQNRTKMTLGSEIGF